MNSIHERLEGGDLRSIGGADVVLEYLYKDTSLFDKIFECLYSDNPVVKMRSADVIEKFTLRHSVYLQPYKDKLLRGNALIVAAGFGVSDCKNNYGAHLLYLGTQTHLSKVSFHKNNSS